MTEETAECGQQRLCNSASGFKQGTINHAQPGKIRGSVCS